MNYIVKSNGERYELYTIEVMTGANDAPVDVLQISDITTIEYLQEQKNNFLIQIQEIENKITAINTFNNG